MSEEYIIFIMPHNKYNSKQIEGYLEGVAVSGTIGNEIRSGTVFNNNTELQFPKDKKPLSKIEFITEEGLIDFSEINNLPKEYTDSYTFFRSEIHDKEQLSKDILLIKEKYPKLMNITIVNDSYRYFKMKERLKPLIKEICNRKDTEISPEEELMIF